MPNTKVQRTLHGAGASRKVVRLINIISDATQETDLVIFSNAAFINDATKGRLLSIEASGSSCLCRLEWDQTADSHLISFNPSTSFKLDFCEFGGISNPNGTGATGDLLLTTTGLAAGSEVTIIIEMLQE